MSSSGERVIPFFSAKPLIQSKKRRELPGKVLSRAFIVGVVLVWTIPIVGLLVTSFRTSFAIQQSGWWSGLWNWTEFEQWTLANYESVLYQGRMASAFFNSLLITIPASVIPITVATCAAYAIAWMKFPGRTLLYIFVVGLLVVPIQMILIPVLRVYTSLGLTGTYEGLWLAHTGIGMPLATYLLYGYIASIPKEIIESAYADGATPWITYTRFIIPLALPAIASFAILQFQWVWNDLLVALVFFGTRTEIVTTRLAELVGSEGQNWHRLTAGAFVSMVMPFVVFFALQPYFVRGMTTGSVKG